MFLEKCYVYGMMALVHATSTMQTMSPIKISLNLHIFGTHYMDKHQSCECTAALKNLFGGTWKGETRNACMIELKALVSKH